MCRTRLCCRRRPRSSHNAGSGTLTKSLIYGVLLMCVPLLSDQPDNAARVVAAIEDVLAIEEG
jgi:hypothetical protein